GGGGGGGHVGEFGSGVGSGDAIVTQPQGQSQHAGDDGALPEGGDDNPHAETFGCEDPVGPSCLPTVFSPRLSSDPSCFLPDVIAVVPKQPRPGTATCIGDSGASTHGARDEQNGCNQPAPAPGEDVWLAMGGGELCCSFDPGEIHLLEEQCDVSNDSSAFTEDEIRHSDNSSESSRDDFEEEGPDIGIYNASNDDETSHRTARKGTAWGVRRPFDRGKHFG
ncbi:unnamed protein product, partial [Scytosiphon promiscuus]